MTCDTLLNDIKSEYDIVRVFSNRNDALILDIRHKITKKHLVLHKFKEISPTYDVLKAIRHPNLPEVYDVYHCDDGQIVLEEFLNGITVNQALECNTYTYSGAKKVISSLCDALSFLHSKGIVHRDIKPENIIITDNGQIKLIDFNTSRKYSKNTSSDTVILGTIGYASPEQFGITQSDPRSDIYALGVLLNVMLTGKHPSEKLAKGRAGRIVLKCTQIDPNKRYQTAQELQYNL